MVEQLEQAFAENVAKFHEFLVGNWLEDGFGVILVLANVEARLREGSEELLPYGEVLKSCEQKLGLAIVAELDKIWSERDHTGGNKCAVDGVENGDMSASPSAVAAASVKRKQKARTSRGKPAMTQEERREKLEARNRKFKQREQEGQRMKQAKQDLLLQEQLKREEEDLPRLQRAAELCRLVESLRVVMSDKVSGDKFSENALEIFSKLVCAGLDEHYKLLMDELKTYRTLANRTNTLADQVESSDDDPYLKTLSSILKYGDQMIRKLLLGEYAVAASTEHASQKSSSSSSTVDINRLATTRIVQKIESKTSATVVFVLEALCKDKKIDKWLEKVEKYNVDEHSLTEEDIRDLNNLLNEVMDAQRYCGYFTTFLASLGVLDAKQIESGGIREKQLELATKYYIPMEIAWISYSLKKAKRIATVTGEGNNCVNSLVENTFYVIRNGFTRAVHTENGFACSTCCNHIHRLIEEDYSVSILILLEGKEIKEMQHAWENHDGSEEQQRNGNSVARQNSTEGENPEDLFAAALESDLQGLGTLSSSLLIGVNTTELSAKFMAEFTQTVWEQFEMQFPAQAPMVDMAIQGFQATATLHEQLVQRAIEDIVANCLKPSILIAIDEGVQNMTYNLNHSTFEHYERSDPFVSKFMHDHVYNGRNFKKCQTYLTHSNFYLLILSLAESIAAGWEQKLLQYQTFNELGSLRFDADVRMMIESLTNLYMANEDDDLLDEIEEERAIVRQEVRARFARLLQFSFLIGLEKASYVEQVPYSFPLALSEADIRIVLRKRVPVEPNVDIDQLDVSMHVKKEES